MSEEDDANVSSSPPIVRHGKTCTGCLYHSSFRQDDGRDPLCVGFSRSEKQAYKIVGEHPQFDELNDGKRLLEFRYACLGYSVYNKQQATVPGQERPVELPACLGLEMQLLDPRKAAQSHTEITEALSQDAHNHEEAGAVLPRHPPQSQRIRTAKGDEFSTRFVRTAGLIASAVGNNLLRVAGSIKTGIDDIFYPDRRQSK